MFGASNFQFETPNVIDPGDLPPQRPSGSNNNSNNLVNVRKNNSRTPDTADTNDNDSYEEARESRLLNDISDLELSPVKPALPRSERLPFRDFPKKHRSKQANQQHRAYSPYDDDADDDEDEYNQDQHHHSLPRSAEEARFHAASLLRHHQQLHHHPSSPIGSSASAFGLKRTMRLTAPRFVYADDPSNGNSKQRNYYMLREIWFYTKKYFLPAALVIAVLVGATFGIRHALENKSNRESNHSKGKGPTLTIVNKDPKRLQDVLDFLAGSDISTAADLEDSNSAAHHAAIWIAQQDALQYAIPSHPSDSSTRFLQRYVLAVLYFTTAGTPWENNPGFLSDTDECGWSEAFDVEEYLAPEISMGVSCNQQLQVTSLFLPGNGLKGDLPMELRYLSGLQLLGLQFNEITGKIPDFQDSLQGLLYVNLYSNNITGTIPSFWADMPQLEVLALGDNDLTGPVPSSIGMLTKLKTLSLDMNLLTGPLQFARHMPDLEFFYAEDNAFDDTLDASFFQALPQLVQLDLSNNQLKGHVPLDLLLVDLNLDVLDLAFNSFTGQFPVKLEQANYQTHYINLRSNRFSGSLPNNLDGLFALEHLDLHDNQFTGTLPNALGRCAELMYLYLGGTNHFNASTHFPPLSQLLSLRELSMEALGLQGQIPYWIQYLESLQLLDLSHNALTGVIPDEVWLLPDLQFLLMHNNQLVGPLPTVHASKLSLFSLHHNKIQDPNMDAALCHMKMTSDQEASHPAEQQIFAAVDCDAGCSSECCTQSCCDTSQDDCHQDVLDYYTDGLDYEAQPFAMDPDILDEAGIIETYPLPGSEYVEEP